MTQSLPEPIRKTLRTIAHMNITVSSSSQRLNYRTTRTTYTYIQQWKPLTLLVLVAFLREKVPSLSIEKDEDIIRYIGDTGKEVLTEIKESAHRKHRFALLYFLGAFMGAAFLIGAGAGEKQYFVPAAVRLLAFILIIAAAFLVWFNTVRFRDVAEHLKQDALTREDCTKVLEQLPKKERVHKIRYVAGAVMAVLAVVMIPVSANINKAALEKKYAQIEAAFDENKNEIENLISERAFAEAWQKTEEYYKEANEVEDALRMNDHTISETYYSEYQRKIMRTLVTGFWMGKSTNPDYPYQVYYVTDFDDGYWSFAANQEFSAEELLQIVEQYKTDYYVPAKSVSISKGAVKSVTFYTTDGSGDLELQCRNFPEEILTIGDGTFTRVE